MLWSPTPSWSGTEGWWPVISIGPSRRRYPDRSGIDDEIEKLVVWMAKENSDWFQSRYE